MPRGRAGVFFVPLEGMAKVEMEVLAVQAFEHRQTFALLLGEKYGSRRLPIIIGYPEAHAINISLDNMRPPRPITHDLFANTLMALRVSMREVTIYKLENSTFLAYLVLEARGEEFEIDCRPSDGIALALRMKAPIYCEEEILAEVGHHVDTEEEEPEPSPRSSSARGRSSERIRESLDEEELERRLKEALAREDYETAARLRDELARLKRQKGDPDS